MNITIDNYEAYLVDYLDGNLSESETKQLQSFVAAQGLDWDELTEKLPHLEAPALAYENKEGLKKKVAVVPLYVKIASAAAAAGLLLTVGLWPEKQLPKMEPIAELKPVAATRIERPSNRMSWLEKKRSKLRRSSWRKQRCHLWQNCRKSRPRRLGLKPLLQFLQSLISTIWPIASMQEWLSHNMKAIRSRKTLKMKAFPLSAEVCFG